VEFFHEEPAPRESFLLAVGSLVPYKRFELAIEAARRVRKPLVIVGRGPEQTRLRAMADSSVRFLVNLEAEQLRSLYRTCAFFVQPCEEDFGIASVEALACGAPVVALSRGGAADIVRDGENGILYGGDGPEALAAAIERAEATRFDYTRMRDSALPFGKERFVSEFQEEVENLLGTPGR
jgi:glycosyltransferase involved in cell wall biosynthesis